MKKVIALIIAVMMLASMMPMALAATTVNVSVSVDGKLVLAAQPVSISDMTVNGAIKAAHKAYCAEGEGGYAAGVDATYNMFLISKCWGVTGTPYVIINDAPLGADPANPAAADVAAVKSGDNIVLVIASDATKASPVVSMKAAVSGSSATITATVWTLDFTTFTYKSAPHASAAVVDDKGTSLGTTDANGSAKVAIPASGIIAIKGLSAIHVSGAAAPAASAAPDTSAAPAASALPAASAVPAGGVSAVPDVSAAAPSAGASAVPAAAGEPTTVYISVSVDGKLEVAAEPVTVTDLTVQGAIKAAHTAYFSGGESGYTAGIDPTWNMFLITKCWGVATTPYVIINGAPMGSDAANPATADTAPVKAGDNIILAISSDAAKPATVVSLTADVKDGSATVTAASWTLDMTTFTYSSAPLADAAVIDPATGASLGKTDANGVVIATAPESGVIAIEGLAAIRVTDAAAAATNEAAASAAPAVSPDAAAATTDDGGNNTILFVIIGIVVVAVIVIIGVGASKKSKTAKQNTAKKK